MKRVAWFHSSCILSFLFITLSVVSGCTAYRDLPAGTVREIGSAVVAREQVAVPPPVMEAAPAREYLVGPGDVLLVNVTRAATARSRGAGSTAPAPCTFHCLAPLR